MTREVSPEEVWNRLDEFDVIDIRTPEEFREGCVPGAENIPFEELTSRLADREWGSEVVVVCRHGNSSIQAARLIEAYEGAGESEVASMEGGYLDWSYELEEPRKPVA